MKDTVYVYSFLCVRFIYCLLTIIRSIVVVSTILTFPLYSLLSFVLQVTVVPYSKRKPGQELKLTYIVQDCSIPSFIN